VSASDEARLTTGRECGKVAASERLLARAGAAAGLFASALLAAVFVGLTVYQADHLRAMGWSAVHRSKVEWPSLLELGPAGWIEVVVFILIGPLGLLFALALFRSLRTKASRAGAALLGLMSLAVPFMAFEPDVPAHLGAQSWHSAIHNGVYPVIPASALLAGVCLAVGLRNEPGWRSQASVAAGFLAIAVVSLAVAEVAAVAQLARYFFFGALLAWMILLTVVMLRMVRNDRSPRGGSDGS
jgi:Protein of unknown function (DUF998)